jgi:hypothetical protein
VDKVMSAITDPKRMETYSTPERITEVVYEAATDGKDKLRYLAGADAVATYATRLQASDELFTRMWSGRPEPADARARVVSSPTPT